MNQQQLELTNKQQEILDSILEQALNNVENFEGIKSGIVRNGALALFHSGVKKSGIARLLVKTLANKDVSKKTGISKRLIYKVLRGPEFKALKSESHAKSRRGRGHNQNVDRCTGASINKPSPTCIEILQQEVKEIKEQKPDLSDKEIRDLVNQLDSVKQFKPQTLRNAWPKVLPLREAFTEKDKTPRTEQPGVPPYVIDQQQLANTLIEKVHKMNEVIEWLSGMKRDERKGFEDELGDGQVYTLALADKCRNHITVLVKMMPFDYLNTFLRCADEITHLIRIFDEKLYEEKVLKESKRNMASR